VGPRASPDVSEKINISCLYRESKTEPPARSLVAMPTTLPRAPLPKTHTHTHTHKHEIRGMDKIMERLDNTGIQVFVLAALKERSL